VQPNCTTFKNGSAPPAFSSGNSFSLGSQRALRGGEALRDKGIANRKAVLGEDYVNKSMASADDFNRPFQDILNEYCWGMIWSDERLPRKTRSMLNLVMLACLNRMHEWELHLKGALRNGVTKDEIQAIIHQIAIYAGVPLAVECFRAARKVFAELEKGA